jgi:hypothetical protein
MYKILIALAIVVSMCGGSYYIGRQDGRAIEIADRVADEELVKKVVDAARQGAAQEIAAIEVKHVTIQGRLQKTIEKSTFYRDCEHSDDGLRDINEILQNGGRSGSDSQLPEISPSTKRQ